jgi:Vitamin K-dependent gamma-carboxylase
VSPGLTLAAPFTSFRAAWNRFFFEPQSPLNIAVFRIIYGVLVLATALLLRGDWLAWYGPHSWISAATMHVVEPGTRLNLFSIIPQTDFAINSLFVVFILAAACLTVGFCTRASSIVVYLCLTSIDQRNLFILHGGDTFLRVSGFFLIFAPAGDALSVDRWLRLRRGQETAELRPRLPWAQRMIQLELAFLYLVSFWWKMKGGAWTEGSALYFIFHLEEFQRFPIPQFLLRPAILRIGSWAALALEFLLGAGIWIKKFRYPLLVAGVLFHLSLEYAINVPLFQWDVLSAYVLFIDPADLARFLDRFVHRNVNAPTAVRS